MRHFLEKIWKKSSIVEISLLAEHLPFLEDVVTGVDADD